MNIYEATLAALRVERQRIDAAITSLEALTSRPSFTLEQVDAAMRGAADTLDREAATEASQKHKRGPAINQAILRRDIDRGTPWVRSRYANEPSG